MDPQVSPGHRFVCAAHQLLGERELQNDSYAFSSRGVFLADGIGSGEASRQAADTVCHFYRDLAQDLPPPADLATALVNAPQAVAPHLPDDPAVASTLAGAILADGLLWTVSHGDSALLLVRSGELLIHSRAHNGYFDNTELGRPTDRSALALLTRSLARQPRGESEIQVTSARPGDLAILLSDGFAELVSTGEVVQAAGLTTPDDVILALLERLSGPAHDNASCVVGLVVAA